MITRMTIAVIYVETETNQQYFYENEYTFNDANLSPVGRTYIAANEAVKLFQELDKKYGEAHIDSFTMIPVLEHDNGSKTIMNMTGMTQR